MKQHVGITVPIQRKFKWNIDPAQPQRPSRLEAMRVVPDTDSQMG
jgi:hypothetical protein